MKSGDDLFRDLDKFRTPGEMKKYFNNKKQIINNDMKYTKLARLKKGRFKEFFEEFYPLYCFSQTKYYDDNAKCKIVIGNQNYDAVIKMPNGTEKKIEITSRIDGKWEYKNAQKLNQQSIGNFRFNDSFSLGERALNYLDKIIVNANRKSLKNYNGVSLLFVVDTYDYFEVFNNSSKQFILTLKDRMSNIEFVAEEVYLLILNNKDIEQINNNIYLIKGS